MYEQNQMLFSYEELYRWCSPKSVRGVIHVGAHLCEEIHYYNALQLKNDNVIWVEANPDHVKQSRMMYPQARIIEALCTDVEGQTYTFKITSNEGQSSSILDFGVHAIHHPHVKFVDEMQLTSTCLETIITPETVGDSTFKNLNMMNLDVQGAELLVLKGATKILPQIDYIYIEVNIDEVYKGCAQLPEMDAFLDGHGFQRVCEKIYSEYKWGDALYVRKTLL